MKNKPAIAKLWLYRYRFIIGYTLLGLAFVAAITLLPLITPGGLSEAEMQSAAKSYDLQFVSLANGDIVDLPYRALQKLSILIFGLSAYSVKLPSIAIGLLLGLLLILLLNRWFKSNVALFASIISVFSTPFLYLTGSGTPLIMLVFWPTLLLWLGSKIQIKGNKPANPIFSFMFAFALLLSIFTPHLIYLAIFIILFAIINPHLRFTIKHTPKAPLITTGLIIFAGAGALIYSTLQYPATATTLFFTDNFSADQFFNNLHTAFLPFISWNTSIESIFLSPLFGLASIALALAGLVSTARGFFASRNAIASCFIVFAVILSGLNPDSAILLVLPMAILIAHGLRYILEKWYDLFPENPYARIFAILPISIFLGIIIITDLSHFIFGYRYTPIVANQFNNDLALVQEHLSDGDTLVATNPITYQFYQILSHHTNLTVTDTVPTQFTGQLATLGRPQSPVPGTLNRIITSSKSDNSDRIYLYTPAEPPAQPESAAEETTN